MSEFVRCKHTHRCLLNVSLGQPLQAMHDASPWQLYLNDSPRLLLNLYVPSRWCPSWSLTNICNLRLGINFSYRVGAYVYIRAILVYYTGLSGSYIAAVHLYTQVSYCHSTHIYPRSHMTIVHLYTPVSYCHSWDVYPSRILSQYTCIPQSHIVTVHLYTSVSYCHVIPWSFPEVV